jgi:predicted ATPase
LKDLLAREASSDAPTNGEVGYEGVLQCAGGVPFFVVSYAQALSRGDIAYGADAGPWDVIQGVRQRVAALPESARTLLGGAAVCGRTSALGLLLAEAARPMDQAVSGLDLACQARLLVDIGGGYQFTHDVIREVIEADLGSARRAVLNRRVASAIDALHGDKLSDHYEALADHYLRAQAWDRALPYLVQAGDKATRAGAIGEALTDLRVIACRRPSSPRSSVGSVS